MADLNLSLLIFLLIVIITFLFAKFLRIRTFSAVVLSLLIGYFVLMTIQPYTSIESIAEGNLLTVLYLLVNILVPIIILIYVILKIFSDIENINYCNYFNLE